MIRPDIPSTAAASFPLIQFNPDVSAQVATAETHAIEVTVGEDPTGSVAAMATGVFVDVVHQHTGTYSTPDQASTDAESLYEDGGAVAEGCDGNEIMKDDNDYIWIGQAQGDGEFDELQVIMGTPATKNCVLTFFYINTGDAEIQFYPVDNTIGLKQTGTIVWNPDDFTNWKATFDPDGGDSEEGYWIKIYRTRNADPGSPTPTTIKTLSAVEYYWDKVGAIDVLSMEADTVTEGGNAVSNDSEIEAVVEPLIDTLANLTSIQSLTVTLADAGTDAFFGWDDGASAYENLTDAEAEAIMEPLIDTLANLTSVQSLTIGLADAGADAFYGWDDTASTYENLTDAEALAVIGGTANDFDASGDVTIAAADISDQDAGTDIAADLEEETHASEHLADAADEIFGEALGTACAINEIWKSDGDGTVSCQADAGGAFTDFDTDYGAETVTSAWTLNNIITLQTDAAYIPTAFTDEGLNAAIDALGATGGVVWLPEGTGAVDATITYDQNNTTVMGTGYASHRYPC